MLYSEKVMDHFRNPRNVGEIADADGVGEVGNAKCGDIMKMYLKIEDGIIVDVKFETFGCGSAIATSSMATELIKGKQVDEALSLTNQAVVEALDGLPAHKIHCSVLAEEAVRFQQPISLCMFDIDKFKVYNDTFGHPAGDRVISAVAKEVSAHFRRATDLFARYGGEEFVAVFVGGDGQSAFEFLKEIRQAVEDMHIPHDPSVGSWVTISVGGVTLRPKAGDSFDTYLKLADTMLYDAKRLGRNQVVWSDGGKGQLLEK